MRGLLSPSRYRGLTVVLLACALAMRMLVPSGFMLTPAADGSLPLITVCTGQGAMTMPMPTGMHHAAPSHGAPQQDQAPDHPCAFAAASAAVDLAALSHPLAPAPAAAAVIPSVHAFIRPGLGLAAPPPPKTGPPLRA